MILEKDMMRPPACIGSVGLNVLENNTFVSALNILHTTHALMYCVYSALFKDSAMSIFSILARIIKLTIVENSNTKPSEYR